MTSTPATSPQAALPAGVDAEAEYRSIERALLESARGRWFLAEHSRRARRVDSDRLDDALAKLQSSIRQPPALLGQLKHEVSNLQAQLAEARARVLSKAGEPGTEVVPSAMLRSVESLHALAWDLQAAPIDEQACRHIGQVAGEIYAYSVSQAAISRRAAESVAVMDAAAARLDGILQTLELEEQIDIGD